MPPIPPKEPNTGFKVLPLWDLAAGHKRLEADVHEGFGDDIYDNATNDPQDELKELMDRIANDVKRLESFVKSDLHDTTPDLCLDDVTQKVLVKERPQTPTMIVGRLSGLVETIRAMETSAYESGNYMMADGLSSLGRRFEETLWMMVVNVRNAILAAPDTKSNPGPPAGPNT